MSFSTNQRHKGPLSATSYKMLELRDLVFSEWEKRVRASIKQSLLLRHPILIDTLPAFYDNIAEALSADSLHTDPNQGNTLAVEHGGERARLTDYDHQALISEYQMFRSTIFDVLHDSAVSLTHRETLVINGAIDEGIKNAVDGFALAHAGLRERFIAALTHDLRGPLGAAFLAAEAVDLARDDHQREHFSHRVKQNLQRVDNMINELLSSMAFENGQRLPLEFRQFDMLELVNEVVTQAVATAGPRFIVLGAPIEGWWSWDAMRRALDNVVGNAIKYGTPETLIHIRVDELHERLLLSVHNEGPPVNGHLN